MNRPPTTNRSVTFAEALSQYPYERKYLARMTEFMDMRLDDITDEAIRNLQWKMYPAHSHSEGTRRRQYQRPLRTFFNWAAEQGSCTRRDIPVPPEPESSVPLGVTPEEIALLLSELLDDLRPIILLISLAGCTLIE